jgi:hypothetical protein
VLRLAAALLLLGNLAFLAWSQGWLVAAGLPARPWQSEPARLAAQVRPELMTVIPPKATPGAVAAARQSSHKQCLEAGPFTDKEADAAEASLAQSGLPGGSWNRDSIAGLPPWAVYMGRFADREAMRTKEDELRRLKVGYRELRAPATLAPGLELGTHPDKAAAEAALAQLVQRGVRTARVVELPAAPPQTWLRAPAADLELQLRLKAAVGVGAGFAACKAR